jgi:hypothetical protein
VEVVEIRGANLSAPLRAQLRERRIVLAPEKNYLRSHGFGSV